MMKVSLGRPDWCQTDCLGYSGARSFYQISLTGKIGYAQSVAFRQESLPALSFGFINCLNGREFGCAGSYYRNEVTKDYK
jgi:hypothetical protein